VDTVKAVAEFIEEEWAKKRASATNYCSSFLRLRQLLFPVLGCERTRTSEPTS